MENEAMSSVFAARLLLSRRDLDLNQDQLALLAKVSRAYISDLERGKVVNPTVDVIEALAKALDVRPEYLLGWSDDATGEDRPGSVAERRVVYEVANAAQYHRMQQVLALFNELDWEYQELALKIIEEFGRAQQVRVIE